MTRKVITVEEFEQMTPAQQDAAFANAVVWDLDDVPQELVARTRARVEARIATEAEAS
jgi:hypothetical protein